MAEIQPGIYMVFSNIDHFQTSVSISSGEDMSLLPKKVSLIKPGDEGHKWEVRKIEGNLYRLSINNAVVASKDDNVYAHPIKQHSVDELWKFFPDLRLCEGVYTVRNITDGKGWGIADDGQVKLQPIPSPLAGLPYQLFKFVRISDDN
ncbi:hypothetical protein B7463_g7316, partial [Scytalidium lignicola]